MQILRFYLVGQIYEPATNLIIANPEQIKHCFVFVAVTSQASAAEEVQTAGVETSERRPHAGSEGEESQPPGRVSQIKGATAEWVYITV